MLAGVFSSAVATVVGAFLLIASVLVYSTLIRQISIRRAASPVEPGVTPAKTFGLPEAFIAAGLIIFLLLGVIAAIRRQEPTRPEEINFAADLLFRVIVILVIAASLKLRGADIDALAGFSKITLKRALSTAVVLLLAAAPLLFLAEALTQVAFGGESSRQQIVDLFNNSRTISQRVIIISLAVVVAPISEEFIFRFFIYGVLRRYFGVALGLVFNSALFAAAHTHLPSAAPLFVLGACFTLAYEWSGSILISMGMHALFNSVQLIFLAFPDIFSQ
jgi:membrane protease YdiL (CAAX protease family)